MTPMPPMPLSRAANAFRPASQLRGLGKHRGYSDDTEIHHSDRAVAPVCAEPATCRNRSAMDYLR
jgi:hypothetical protein